MLAPPRAAPLVGLLALALCPAACRAPSPSPASLPAATGSARPRLVVSIVVDQLSAWVVEERLALLPETGGLRRLAREGARVRRVEYAHAVTDTAPGHASLYTGKSPRETRIFGNEVFDATGARVSILRDERTRVVTVDGARERPGSSPARLAVPTVAEAHLAARPDARVLSLSWKDRGAILPAGHPASGRTTALWFDVGEDAWVSSTAYGPRLPAFARDEVRAHPAAEFRRAPWTLSDAAWVEAHAATPDRAAGEGDLDGLGTVFPHSIPTPKAMRATPAADALVLSMARAGLEASPAPTLLLLSLSANDYVGHVFGPDSWEAWDQLARLDRALGELFTWLDGRYGASGWAAALSADHGNVSTPEALARGGRACGPGDPFARPCAGVRMLPDELGARLRGAVPGVVGICDPWVFLDPHTTPDARRAAEAGVEAALAKEPGVLRTFSATWLSERCPVASGEDPIAARVCASYSPGAGDVYVVAREGAFFDPLQVPGSGVSHGSPHLYDRTVPLFVRAPQLVGEGQIIDGPLGFQEFRASLELLLGLSSGPAWLGREGELPASRRGPAAERR
ncbi:MAG: alkaline phosphatase family protein [Polyangiaceae bacterium]|nr:alkaline phosphatase family protein [Polyangiaceae bacterium]